MVLLIIGACLNLFSSAPPAVKSTVAGLALANAVMGFVNVFFSPEAQMQDHPYYIIGITTWLPFFIFLWPFLEKLQARRARASYVLASGLFLIGAWEGFNSANLMLPVNKFQAATIRKLPQLGLTPNDLVVAPSRFSDDISSWIPLIAPAKVLYTPDGENILSAGDTQIEQTFRQAIYLMLTGVNSRSFSARTEPNSPDSGLTTLICQTERAYAESPLASDRLQLRRILRQRLLPLISQLSENPSTGYMIFAAYRRVVVIDNSTDPSFDANALSKWILISNIYEDDQIKLYIGVPRFDAARDASHVDIAQPGVAVRIDAQIR
jgi:hypothetical protein